MKEINFAQNLNFLRSARQMTQQQLAELIGVDQRTVSAWERGICEPSFAMLARLCEVFDETFDGLLSV